VKIEIKEIHGRLLCLADSSLYQRKSFPIIPKERMSGRAFLPHTLPRHGLILSPEEGGKEEAHPYGGFHSMCTGEKTRILALIKEVLLARIASGKEEKKDSACRAKSS